MSKKLPKTAKKLNYKATSSLIPLSKVQTEWDLESLYYKSGKDPQIEKDLKKVESAHKAFEKKYSKKNFTLSSTTLLKSLVDYEKLCSMKERRKAMRYFGFRTVLNTKDIDAEKNEQKISRRLTEAANLTLFFTLKLGQVSKKHQRAYLKDKKLAKYHYYLKRTFLEAQHNLSEEEEKILNLLDGPAYGMWMNGTDKIIASTTITFKGKKIPLTTAIESVENYNSKDKKTLWNCIMKALEAISIPAENELTAIATTKLVEDKLRGFEKPYSATILSYEDEDKSVESLLEAVRTKGFSLSKSFYKTKAAFHGKDTISYVQKYDSIGPDLHIPFKQAVNICRDVFYNTKTEYGTIFDNMLESGQIDVFPKPGKRGGAFMSEGINVPTQVMLNHTNTFKSLETLAHEMGHAIHSERSKQQPTFYQGHSITTAETASTLFENLLFDAVYEQASKEARPILIHDRITRDIATIQRQIAFFNFELEMHQIVREQGTISHSELRKLLQKNLQAYLGPAVDVSEADGNSYIYVPHFRYGFYVYTYTFGILMSTIMANNLKSNPEYIAKIDHFLSSGQSDTVANIFKSVGINTTKTTTFIDALRNHEADIKEFKKLTQK